MPLLLYPSVGLSCLLAFGVTSTPNPCGETQDPKLRPIVLDVTYPNHRSACVDALTAYLNETRLPFVGFVSNAGSYYVRS